MSNNNSEEQPKAVIRWSTTSKVSEYDVRELPAIRKSAVPGGTGYLYYNKHTERHEKPRSIDFVQPPPKRRKLAGA